MPPYSVYLEDYHAIGSLSWQLNLTFLDLVEPSREVYLKLKIESNEITIQTVPGFIPATGGRFTLLPGQPQLISGEQLSPYFAYEALSLSGITWTEIQNNGRLPEGFYTFCAEVIDVYSGEVLSREMCSSSWLKLNDEPIFNSPLCGAVVDPSIPTLIPFQWQSVNLLSPNSALSTEFQLTVFEITDQSVAPISAVNNGSAIQIFQTPWQMQSNYNYTIADPILDVGKTYAFTVQARDNSGRDYFKNNGYAEFCWFHYGYPEGGTIPLLNPTDSLGFSKYQPQYFRWDPASNLLPGQPVTYSLEVVELDSAQTAEDGFQANPIWHEEVFPISYGGLGRDFELDKTVKPFGKGVSYGWKVSAITGNQTVALSEINTFLGPPLVDEFFVNRHRVEVVSLSTNNLLDLGGVGMVWLNETGTEKALLNFEHIALINLGGIYYLEEGGLQGEVMEVDSLSIALSPVHTPNGLASANYKQVRLSNDTDLEIRASLQWQLPHAANTPEIPYVTGVYTWLNFSEYQINGRVNFNQQAFNLLDPYGFKLTLDLSSEFIIINDAFELEMDGKLEVPYAVPGFDEDTRVALLFEDQIQLFYFSDNKTSVFSRIVPVGEANIRIEPLQYTVDLSVAQSPLKFNQHPEWKGVYFDAFKLKYLPTMYGGGSIQFTESIEKQIELDAEDSTRSWITSSGYDLLLNETFASNAAITFNTFPGALNNIRIEAINSSISNSFIDGSIKIPVISESTDFGWRVPLTTYGYNQGYLNDTLDNVEFVFSAGAGDNELTIGINHAVFEDNSHLVMNLDIDWPGMNTSFDNVDGFRVWGNYNIGFGGPNGVWPLQEQVQGKAGEFDVTIAYLGAGRDANIYSFGASGSLQLGEDVSGGDGGPEYNAYSLYKSNIIPEDYIVGTSYMFGDPTNIGDYTGGSYGADGAVIGENDQDNLAFAMGVLGDAIAGLGDGSFSSEDPPEIDLGDFLDENGDTINFDIQETIEKIFQMIDLVSPFLNEELREKAAELKAKIQELQTSELYEVYMEVQNNGFNLEKILKAQVDKLVALINNKITEQVTILNGKIDDAILNPVDTMLLNVKDVIGDVVDEIADIVKEIVGGSGAVSATLVEVIDDAAETTKTVTYNNLRDAVIGSIEDNITDKAKLLIDTIFTKQVTAFVEEQITGLGYAIIDNDLEEISMQNMVEDVGGLLGGMAEDVLTVFKGVSLNGIKETCFSLVEDAYNNISWDSIGNQIKEGIMDSIDQIMADAIMNVLDSTLSDLIGEDLMNNITQNIDLNFDNLGENLMNGDIDEIVSFDPTHVSITSKVADVEGMIDFMNDTIWGEAWVGYLNANIKKPKEFTAYVKFLNGKKDDYNYWFLGMGVPSGLNVPIFSGLVLDGIGGKVFKHMNYDYETKEYLPDPMINFGVGVDMWVVDAPTMGESVKLDVSAEVTVADDYFTMAIRGDVAVASKDNSKDEEMDAAVVNGSGFLSFSTLDNFLIGQFDVETNIQPIICAQGQLGLEVGPGSWYVYAGKQTDPMVAKILCMNLLTVNTWFEISDQNLLFGVQSNVSLSGQTPWFKIVRHWSPYADFGWDFLVNLDMDFKPQVKVNDAQLYIHVWGGVGVHWENRNSNGEVTDSGTFVFASVDLEGNVHYHQDETDATFQGSLAGEVTIIGLSIGFDLQMNKSMQNAL